MEDITLKLHNIKDRQKSYITVARHNNKNNNKNNTYNNCNNYNNNKNIEIADCPSKINLFNQQEISAKTELSAG